uniref:Uncharacterized protein n=1 Tax=Arundo donax TaxID=35708 RepID=A0A0A9F1J1_ARUDO
MVRFDSILGGGEGNPRMEEGNRRRLLFADARCS